MKQIWNNKCAETHSLLENLSNREFEVLTRVGKGLSLRAVGTKMGISDKTVSTYQKRLMKKLNLYNKFDLVKFALQSGLIN
jgi:DNA-binding NarL/FixJ family response regulator